MTDTPELTNLPFGLVDGELYLLGSSAIEGCQGHLNPHVVARPSLDQLESGWLSDMDMVVAPVSETVTAIRDLTEGLPVHV